MLVDSFSILALKTEKSSEEASQQYLCYVKKVALIVRLLSTTTSFLIIWCNPYETWEKIFFLPFLFIKHLVLFHII